MLVKEKMTPQPIFITKETTLATALQLMRDNKIRRLPVLEGDKLIGIVTDRDLREVTPSPATSLSMHELNYLLAKTKIGSILPKKNKVITIDANAFLEEAALLMRDHKIGGIPVVEGDKLVGIITETNIFDAFIEIMGLRQEGFRITVKMCNDRPGILAEITKTIAACGGNITHSNTIVRPGEATLTLRINQGSVEEIVGALTRLGYQVSAYNNHHE